MCPMLAVLLLKWFRLELCDDLNSGLAHLSASYAAGRLPTAKA